jgi:hypothetical protein
MYLKTSFVLILLIMSFLTKSQLKSELQLDEKRRNIFTILHSNVSTRNTPIN